jgi:DNA helicase-2/ATP-dependent DNA helicase PcrA
LTWDEDLRPQQREAASAPLGDAVLLAGPGTGKTFVLVRRIQYLIEDGTIPPQGILVLTFSRAAAAEMRERLEDKLGDVGRRVRVSTLHSYALRQLMRHGAPNLPTPLRVAGDWEERWIVVEELARLLGRKVSQIQNRKDGALDRLSDDWDTLAADGEGWQEGHPDAKFLAAWQQHREVYGYTLRSELVYQLLNELRTDPALEPDASDAMLVDEYQDLNRCDLNTIKFLATRTSASVFAAGDDDQSIYSFRHALPAGIRSFETDYQGAQKLLLRECLRCGEEIVLLANWMVEQELNREAKELVSITPWPATVHLLRFRNQESEAAAIARAVQAEIAAGVQPHEILILVKSDARNHISNAIRKALAQFEIDAYLPRAAKVESEALQRVLEYLILSTSLTSSDRVDDLALRALLELENNGIGDTRMWGITSLALNRRIRFSEAIEYVQEHRGETPTLGPVVAASESILARARALAQREGESFDEWLVRVAKELDLESSEFELILLTSRGVTHEVVSLEMSDEARDSEETVPETDEERFDFVASLLEAMSNLSDVAPARMDGRVTFTTMHGAKGLTADTVFVLQAEDEVIPGEAQGIYMDEARRLLYVSLTRARKKLVISACSRRTGPQRFVGQSEVVQRTLTRFLKGLKLEAETLESYLSQG